MTVGKWINALADWALFDAPFALGVLVWWALCAVVIGLPICALVVLVDLGVEAAT